jgi:predicted nucleic acid-binding protein
VSFAVMRKLAIRKAFTFDEHFRLAGFEILR